jgi:hypothetical protein
MVKLSKNRRWSKAAWRECSTIDGAIPQLFLAAQVLMDFAAPATVSGLLGPRMDSQRVDRNSDKRISVYGINRRTPANRFEKILQCEFWIAMAGMWIVAPLLTVAVSTNAGGMVFAGSLLMRLISSLLLWRYIHDWRWHFSVRALFIIMTIVAVLLGMSVYLLRI